MSIAVMNITDMAKTMIQSPPGGGDGGSKASTTFVQADSSTCFRDLVQRLTSPSVGQAPVKSPAPKPTQKLHERRKYIKPKIEIGKPLQPTIPTSLNMFASAGSPGGGFGAWYPTSPPSSLQASPIGTPVLIESSNKRASPSATLEINPVEEEKAIKEKRFYLHPSPRSKPRLAAEPELLKLFPLESPTTSSGNN